jgi:hypothetical protein
MATSSSNPSISRALAGTLTGMFVAVAASLVCLSSAPASAECNGCGGGTNGGGNYTAPGPNSGSAPLNYTMVLSSDLLPALGIASGNSGTVYEPAWADPYCNPSPSGNTCPVQVSYNPSTNETTFVYSGTTLYDNGGTGMQHFGYAINGSHYAVRPVASYWTYVQGSQQHTVGVPLAYVACSCKFTKNSLVAIVFYSAAFVKGSLPVQSWNIVSYVPNGREQPKVQFANYEGQPMEVSDTGIVLGIKPPTTLEGWATLVSMMNATNMPPPGASGSPFQPLLKPPPKVLKPKQIKVEGAAPFHQLFGKRS